MVNILVVDDKSEDLQDLKQAAEGEGRRIVTANSREQALRFISENDFDVVLTDLELESGSLTGGIDVLNAAKEKDPYTEVVVVTGRGTPEVGVKAMALGAFDYILKGALGINIPAMIRAKVTKAIEFRRAQLQPGVVTANQP